VAYTIKYKPAASRQLAKLNKSIQARLKPKIKALANNPRPHGAIKLQGYENRYRIREAIIAFFMKYGTMF
jgi:mRNA interferase RelE/StbE